MTLFIEKELIIEELKKYTELYNEEVIKLFFKRLSLKPSKLQLHNQKLLNDVYEILLKSPYLYEEVYNDLRGGRQRLNIQTEIKRKYKNYDLDSIFKNHEIFNNLDVKSLTQIPKETLLYDEIEKIWHDIDNNDDWSLFNKKIDSINIFKQANINHGLG